MLAKNTAPWVDDSLDRQADGEHLISVLLERYASRVKQGIGSYILNIDAAWGEGKTYFLQNLRVDLEARGHLVAYVNAWEDDHANDPLITVMAAIDAELSPHLPKNSEGSKSFERGKKALGIVVKETGKQMAFHLLKATTGIAVGATIDKLNEAGLFKEELELNDDAYDDAAKEVWDKGLESIVGERVTEHKAANQAIVEFRNHVGSAIEYLAKEGHAAPLFVFVDELDRCRPTYAISLLENLKHLFSIKGVVFVVATDTRQLAHSVKAVYGAEFEAQKYLRRFFDRTFVFPERSKKQFISMLFNKAGINPDATFFRFGNGSAIDHMASWADGLYISNRDISQIFEVIVTFITSFEYPIKIEINYLLALVWSFYEGKTEDFKLLSTVISADAKLSANWTISPLHDPHTNGTVSGLSSITMIRNLMSQSKIHLEVVAQKPDRSLYYDYLLHELHNRFPNGYNPRGTTHSVLRQYPSRVMNAGRVLDKDLPTLESIL